MRVLLTLVGLEKKDEHPTYEIAEVQGSYKGRFSGAAIANLIGPFDRILSVVTPESATRLDSLRSELGPMTDRLFPIEVAVPLDEESQYAVVDKIIKTVVPENRLGEAGHVRLVLDITHSFRSMPLLLFSAVSFLTCFRNLEVEDVLYAHLESNKTPTLIVRLGAAYDLAEWSHAVTLFNDTGQTRRLERLVRNRVESLRRSVYRPKALEQLRKALTGFSRLVGAALPVEIGERAQYIIESVSLPNSELKSFPPLSSIIDELKGQMSHIATSQKGSRQKRRLTRDELHREIRVARWALDRDQISNALMMLSEICINLWLLHDDVQSWMEQRVRETASSRLSALRKINSNPELRTFLTPEQQALARVYDEICQARNRIAHCGFTHNQDPVGKLVDTAHRALEVLPALIESTADPRIPIHHRLLVSPLGSKPGSLYTAIVSKKPDKVLVIASNESRPLLDVTLDRAGMRSDDCVVSVIEDPHAGYSEIPKLVKDAESHLLRSGSIIVSTTGGTTLMGEVASQIHRAAVNLGIESRRFAVADRRTPQEQERNPYVVGECFDLE